MIAITEFLNKAGESESEIYDIQDASRACYSDTTETMQMLEYLTSFGQVKETAQGWIRENKYEYTSRKMFRDFYLKDAVSILILLDENPKTAELISASSEKFNAKDVQEYLEFLTQITQFGYVKKVKSNWKLASYNSIPQVEM